MAMATVPAPLDTKLELPLPPPPPPQATNRSPTTEKTAVNRINRYLKLSMENTPV
jgi:hypothetical protein